jgi:hypothetical protein
LKVIEQLIVKNDPDLEIHFVIILPSLIQLLETQSETIKDKVLQALKLYCQMTANVEQVLSISLKSGVENDNVINKICFTFFISSHILDIRLSK